MKTVFVTGAGSGIGRATAQCLAAEPNTAVICIDLNEKAALETAATIPHGLGVKADVSNEQQCLAAVQKGIEAFGNPSGLVHCAALFGWAELNAITEADLNASLSVNVNGSFFMARAVANAIIESHSQGAIVLFSSGASQAAIGTPLYSATKGAVNALMRELAVAWATQGVRVNAILPGVIVTPMSEAARTDDTLHEFMMSHTPMKRFAQPEEVANVAAFLLSEKSSYITGVCLPVDGGFVAV